MFNSMSHGPGSVYNFLVLQGELVFFANIILKTSSVLGLSDTPNYFLDI